MKKGWDCDTNLLLEAISLTGVLIFHYTKCAHANAPTSHCNNKNIAYTERIIHFYDLQIVNLKLCYSLNRCALQVVWYLQILLLWDEKEQIMQCHPLKQKQILKSENQQCHLPYFIFEQYMMCLFNSWNWNCGLFYKIFWDYPYTSCTFVKTDTS
jgi:hypothetical protein